MYLRVMYILFLGLAMSCCAGTPSGAVDTHIDKTLNTLLADAALDHGIQGVLVESLKDNRVIYEHNSNLLFLPASNFKLVVAATALDQLGPNYRLHTTLYTSSERTSNGILKGDLVLVGGGDPLFTMEQLQSIAAKVKAMGVKVIEGNVVGDDTLFDDSRLGWGWACDDESYYYSAEVSALNLNENVVDYWVRPGNKAGAPALIKPSPFTGYLFVKNECKTADAKSAKAVSVERIHGKNTVLVTGTVPLDFKPARCEEAITVADPTTFTCQTLIDMLRREGIKVKGSAVRGTRPQNAKLIATVDSAPISELLALLLKPSDNLVAECLLKTLGAQMKGKGSESNGEAVELAFLNKIGVDSGQICINDGSGLSRVDYVSPKCLVSMLAHMYKHKDSKVYLDALPIAGVDGTLANRMKGTAAAGNARAKTGHLSHVSALSGFVTTKSGEPLVFSIIMNNHQGDYDGPNRVQDRMLEALANMD